MQGKKPEATTTAYQITNPSITSSGGVAASGANVTGLASTLAADAVASVGKWRYVFGGVPAQGVVDCSSLMNEIIGDQNGLAIPLFAPGTYHGQSHGPPTTVWLVWSGCFTIKAQDAMPGDLAVWQTHMGMIVGANQLVSALNPSLGVRQTTITGAAPPGEVLRIRRLKAVTSG